MGWFDFNVPLLNHFAYFTLNNKFKENQDTIFIELKNEFQEDLIGYDRLFCANLLMTTVLGELKKLSVSSHALQNKLIGIATTLATTTLTYFIHWFNGTTSQPIYCNMANGTSI